MLHNFKAMELLFDSWMWVPRDKSETPPPNMTPPQKQDPTKMWHPLGLGGAKSKNKTGDGEKKLENRKKPFSSPTGIFGASFLN